MLILRFLTTKINLKYAQVQYNKNSFKKRIVWVLLIDLSNSYCVDLRFLKINKPIPVLEM